MEHVAGLHLVDDPHPLGRDRTGEPLDPGDRNARVGGDLVRRLARAQPGLDVPGRQGTVADRLLPSAGQVAANGSG